MVHYSIRCKAKTLANKRCSKRKQLNSDYCCIHNSCKTNKNKKLHQLFYAPLKQAWNLLKATTGVGSPIISELYKQFNSTFFEFLNLFKNSKKLELYFLKNKLWHKMGNEYSKKCQRALLNFKTTFTIGDYKYDLNKLVQTNKNTKFCRSILIKFETAKVTPKILLEGGKLPSLGLNFLLSDELTPFINKFCSSSVKLVPDQQVFVENYMQYELSDFRYFKIESKLLEIQKKYLKNKIKINNKKVKLLKGLHLTCKDGIKGILEKLCFNVRMVNRCGLCW